MLNIVKDVAATIQLADLPACGTFVPAFQVNGLGIPLADADVWFRTSESSGSELCVVNLKTGRVFYFDKTTPVYPVNSTLLRG